MQKTSSFTLESNLAKCSEAGDVHIPRPSVRGDAQNFIVALFAIEKLEITKMFINREVDNLNTYR